MKLPIICVLLLPGVAAMIWNERTQECIAFGSALGDVRGTAPTEKDCMYFGLMLNYGLSKNYMPFAYKTSANMMKKTNRQEPFLNSFTECPVPNDGYLSGKCMAYGEQFEYDGYNYTIMDDNGFDDEVVYTNLPGPIDALRLITYFCDNRDVWQQITDSMEGSGSKGNDIASGYSTPDKFCYGAHWCSMDIVTEKGNKCCTLDRWLIHGGIPESQHATTNDFAGKREKSLCRPEDGSIPAEPTPGPTTSSPTPLSQAPTQAPSGAPTEVPSTQAPSTQAPSTQAASTTDAPSSSSSVTNTTEGQDMAISGASGSQGCVIASVAMLFFVSRLIHGAGV